MTVSYQKSAYSLRESAMLIEPSVKILFAILMEVAAVFT